MRKIDARKLAREKNLFRYSSALERGDFDTVTAVLREAERDPLLAQMITEINMVYESETLRLSPSLAPSTNHHQKELLMTTIILPRRQSAVQRWMPITLAAACVAVLLIGAILMRPLRPNPSLAGLQAGSTATPTAAASPTMVPTQLPTFTPTPVLANDLSALTPTPAPANIDPTVVPPADANNAAAVLVPTLVPVCTVVITADQGQVPLYLQAPDPNGQIIGYVTGQVVAKVYSKVSFSDGAFVWYFVNTAEANPQFGWVNAKAISINENQCFGSTSPTADQSTPTMVPAAGTVSMNANVLVKQANDLYTQEKFAEAANAFAQFLQVQPTNIDVLYGYGRSLVGLDRADEAQIVVQQIFSIDAQSISGYSLKALALLKSNDLALALSIALKGYEINPNDAPLLSVLTQIYTAMERYDEALRYGQASIQADSTSAEAHFAYGLALKAAGKNDDAMGQLEAAVRFNPNGFSLYDALASIYKITNQMDQALATYDKLLVLQPANANVLISLCETYSQMGQNDNAQSYCDKAITVAPNNADAYRVRGGVLFRQRNYQDAVSDFKACLSNGSKAIECYYQQGLADYYMGQCDEAWTLLQQASTVDNQPEDQIRNIIATGLQLIKENCPSYANVVLPTPVTGSTLIAQVTALPSTFTPTPAPASGVVEPTLVPPADAQPAAASSATCNSKDAVILTPSSNSVVAGTVTVSGIATAPNFGSYKLEIIGLGTGSKYISAVTSAQAVTTTGTLGQIDLSSYPPENYGLRLTVFDTTNQLQASCLVNITLARAAAIPAASSSDSAVAAVVPANLFPMNAVVITETATHSSPAANSTLGMTLTTGVVVYVDQQTDDGQWLHVTLDGGKNGWVLTNTLQLEGINVQIAAAVNGSTSTTTSSKGIVQLTSTLYELPNLRGKAVGTAQNAAIVTIINKSVDGLWSLVTLQDGTQGWMPTTLIQLSSDLKGIVSVEQAVLRDKPDANGQIIRTIQKNVILTVTGNSTDTQWINVILSDGTQGWLLASEVQTEGVPQIVQPPTLCIGVIGKQGAQVFSQPVLSGTGVVVDTLIPEIGVQIFDVSNQSGAADAWYYIQSFHESHFVQGWVKGSDFEQLNYCAQPSSPPDQFVVVVTGVPTLVPAGVIQPATATAPNGTVPVTIVPASSAPQPDDATAGTVPARPVLDNPIPVPTLVPADVQPAVSAGTIPFCNTGITVDGTNIRVVNQLNQTAIIYAAPLTKNSDATVIGEFPAKAQATLLYQQYDRESDPIGALWYLIMTGEGQQQITGWVSANSVTASDSCASVTDDANATSATASVEPVQLQAITGVALTSSAQTGTCRVTNLNTQPVTVFAAPLTADSNASAIGTFPVQGDAIVIFQNYDQQSAPVGALWYLVSVTGVNQPAITGWVSATSINSANPCAPEQLVGVSLNPVAISSGGVSAVVTPDVAISAPNMCQISNTTDKAATMFAAPLTANSNAPVIGEFPAGSDALLVLQNYDQKSSPVGALWYLITINNGSDKQLTGWISANSINSSSCTAEAAGVSVPVPANVQTQADVVTAPVTSDAMPAVNCVVSAYNNESIPVFSGPNESLVINNLPPDMTASVLYQQMDKTTNMSWYLILAVSKEGKQVSGWISSDSVKIDTTNCPQKP